MKRIFLTSLVTVFVLSLSAALTFLSTVTYSGWLWMCGVSAVLFCTVALIIVVVMLLKDLIQTDGRTNNRQSRIRSQQVDAQPPFMAYDDSQEFSPYGRHCRRRDRRMEREAMDGRPRAQPQVRPPTDSFVPGRKSLNSWHQRSPRNSRESGFHDINQRKQ